MSATGTRALAQAWRREMLRDRLGDHPAPLGGPRRPEAPLRFGSRPRRGCSLQLSGPDIGVKE